FCRAELRVCGRMLRSADLHQCVKPRSFNFRGTGSTWSWVRRLCGIRATVVEAGRRQGDGYLGIAGILPVPAVNPREGMICFTLATGFVMGASTAGAARAVRAPAMMKPIPLTKSATL